MTAGIRELWNNKIGIFARAKILRIKERRGYGKRE